MRLDRSNFLESLIGLLDDRGIRYCVIGGQGAGSKLRVQVQTDPWHFAFVAGATRREVLGVSLPVARLEDVLQGKIWAASDVAWRPSKRRKDLLDIERILEQYPELRERVPAGILSRLE